PVARECARDVAAGVEPKAQRELTQPTARHDGAALVDDDRRYGGWAEPVEADRHGNSSARHEPELVGNRACRDERLDARRALRVVDTDLVGRAPDFERESPVRGAEEAVRLGQGAPRRASADVLDGDLARDRLPVPVDDTSADLPRRAELERAEVVQA